MPCYDPLDRDCETRIEYVDGVYFEELVKKLIDSKIEENKRRI